jgi:hypothetical protein
MRSAPPSSSGRVSDGWIGARRGSSIGFSQWLRAEWSLGMPGGRSSSQSHDPTTCVPPLFRTALTSKSVLDDPYILARLHDGPLERLKLQQWVAKCSSAAADFSRIPRHHSTMSYTPPQLGSGRRPRARRPDVRSDLPAPHLEAAPAARCSPASSCKISPAQPPQRAPQRHETRGPRAVASARPAGIYRTVQKHLRVQER